MLRMGALALPLTVSWAALWRLGTLEARASKLHHHYAPMPHWYLVQIGVEPAFQGRGFAGRLLRPLLARMDAADVPCYLETSKERNVTLYQRFGFAIAGVADVGNSLRMWAMVRRPAKA
jgi:ribosomal protein S18 acetylase RimI-like enzyme